ncbi:MAG TPA: hypothetical protein PLV88_02275 [Methanoregulaceae archaeon]|nr:hypothetical protein [Methanoregulaceae archaeon]MCC7467873.1 hypothetical protein [Burkholderiaceae bacterium]NLH24860.1 hypothetical protein [Methanomicrobiales archaeon]HNB03096.1 hypothetical protein [Methanoregulaceae archaeon]HPS22194.1 hypothetical protein [Methanoregulaceae archaeon]
MRLNTLNTSLIEPATDMLGFGNALFPRNPDTIRTGIFACHQRLSLQYPCRDLTRAAS